MTSIKRFTLLLLLAIFAFPALKAQVSEYNPVSTAVPFLTIAPDARGSALGDAGVASPVDAFSMYYNPAKYAFVEKDMGFGITYCPWLAKFKVDISLLYLSGYKKIDDKQTVAASIRYFNLGNTDFTSEFGDPIGSYKPHEYSIDAAYSRKLTDNLSMSVAARFIHSNLTLSQTVNSTSTKPGNSVAADVALYQQLPIQLGRMDATFAWGVNISNIGSKISYSNDNTRKEFIPTNLRIGPSLTMNINDYNTLSFVLDFNKLLVPTNNPNSSETTSNLSVPAGMIKSFYDAPGGFSEEMKEISIATGVEYWYAHQFAVRGGFFYEDKTKGNRKFASLGAGFRYNTLGVDLSYLVPFEQNNPLANTLRFSLLLNFGDR